MRKALAVTALLTLILGTMPAWAREEGVDSGARGVSGSRCGGWATSLTRTRRPGRPST